MDSLINSLLNLNTVTPTMFCDRCAKFSNAIEGIGDSDVVVNYGKTGYANHEHFSLSQLLGQVQQAASSSALDKQFCENAFNAVQTRIAQRACDACVRESSNFIDRIKSMDDESFASIYGDSAEGPSFRRETHVPYWTLLACAQKCCDEKNILFADRRECMQMIGEISKIAQTRFLHGVGAIIL
jgi:hypothetical protein